MTARIIKTTIQFEGRAQERYTLVEEVPLPPWPPTTQTVGHPTPRVEGPDKVTGYARYTSDVRLPGMLWAKVLRSPYAHARITRIDTTRAMALPGVHAVLTYLDAPPIEWDPGIKLLDRELYFHGDEVAVVAADSEAIAIEALRRIEVVYEPLPFIVEAEAASAEATGPSGIVQRAAPQHRGDVERALRSAQAVVVSGTYRTQPAAHNPLEPHCTIASWEPPRAPVEHARLTVFESTQGIYAVRDQLAQWFGLSASRVNVITNHMGGGFGAKQEPGKHTLLAALLSRRTGRPVMLMLDRKEENLAGGYRAETVQRVQLAAEPTGRLLAIDAEIVCGVGAYRAEPMEVQGPYREFYACPNVRTQVTAVHTNAGPSAPFRAPGYAEGAFALESALDELARHLGMDPLELRRRNEARTDPVSGHPYSAKHLLECYELGAELIGWHRRHQLHQESGVRRGIGMATVVWGGGGGPPAYALVTINSDGSAEVRCGSQDIGTGTRTALALVAAEELGLPLGAITVRVGETAPGVYAPTSAGSGSLSSAGPAVRAAAADARKQLLEIAAALLDADPDELTIHGGVIRTRSRGSPAAPLSESSALGSTPEAGAKSSLTIPQIAERVGEFTIVGRGARGPNPQDLAVRTFGAQFAQVAVDTVTGQVRVERLVSVHDVGRIVNPLTAESLVIGGIVQGVGYALMERQVRDARTGRLLNPNLEMYRVPTALDVGEILVRFIERPDGAANTIGAKGLGEPPIVGVAAAIANAVAAATGVRIRDLPMAPQVVLGALASGAPQ